MNTTHFKKILILFWAFWWLIALWTDVVGGLTHLGFLHASWAPDGNYLFLKESLAIYPLPHGTSPALFIVIIINSLVSATLFFWASFALTQEKKLWMKRANNAFIFSLVFWLLFFLADQLVMKFDLEENHMVQGGFELLCYFALYILPEK